MAKEKEKETEEPKEPTVTYEQATAELRLWSCPKETAARFYDFIKESNSKRGWIALEKLMERNEILDKILFNKQSEVLERTEKNESEKVKAKVKVFGGKEHE